MDEQGRAQLRAASPAAFHGAFVEGFRSGVSRTEVRAPCPTLLVAGEKETAVRPSNAALAALMPHATARYVPGRGHGWLARDPDLHVRMVQAWLTGAQLPAELLPERPSPGGRATTASRAGGAAMTLKVAVPPGLIQGDVDDGYGPVADAFRRNFADRGEVGAACAVYRDGRKVVDLWGGYRDGRTRAPWLADTVVLVNSTTKGVATLALALAHSRGLLDFDERVATYWPQFAWRGKAEVTVRQLLSHQAGLPVVDVPLTVADLADLDLVAAALALQRPLWPPGSRQGYHFLSLGWYEGELLRRVDPAGTVAGPVLRRGDRRAAGPGVLHRGTPGLRLRPPGDHPRAGAVRVPAAPAGDPAAAAGRDGQPAQPDAPRVRQPPRAARRRQLQPP